MRGVAIDENARVIRQVDGKLEPITGAVGGR
jgi:hypothetical protein